MTIEHWVAKATEEIDTLLGRTGHRAEIAKIIAKHCPFQPDTAYVEVVPVEPGYIQDWASRCAGYIAANERASSAHRLASIITHFAEPIVKLLKESRREHEPGDNAPCRMDLDPDYEGQCTCGADAWNKRVDAALSGL